MKALFSTHEMLLWSRYNVSHWTKSLKTPSLTAWILFCWRNNSVSFFRFLNAPCWMLEILFWWSAMVLHWDIRLKTSLWSEVIWLQHKDTCQVSWGIPLGIVWRLHLPGWYSLDNESKWFVQFIELSMWGISSKNRYNSPEILRHISRKSAHWLHLYCLKAIFCTKHFRMPTTSIGWS